MTATPSSNERLLQVAIKAFGLNGFEGASTREIARAAGRPMSAITYQFGGKDGLYRACAQHIADTIGKLMHPTLENTAFDRGKDDVTAARDALARIFGQLIDAMVRDETATFARFIMREQMEPSEAFALIYDGVMGEVLARIAGLLIAVSGDRLSIDEARVRAIALMGQVIAFRIARAAVLRATGWHAIGGDELRAIHDTVQAHLTAILDVLATEGS